MIARRLVLLACLLGAGILGAGSAGADWLVTREGARFETRGPWKVQGRSVVFTQMNGTLASVRAADIDLDQSALLTTRSREAVAPAPPVVPAKRRPVMVLTEKDHPPVTTGGSATSATGAKDRAVEVSEQVQIVSWDQTQMPGGGVELFGSLRNIGAESVTQLAVTAEILDGSGQPLVTVEAQLTETTLEAGAATTFRVAVPGLPQVDGAKFSVRGTLQKPPPETAPAPEPAPAPPAPPASPASSPRAGPAARVRR